jgi:hypothetical protein
MTTNSKYKFNPITGCKVPPEQNNRNKWLELWFKLNDLQYSHDGNHTVSDFGKSQNKRRSLDMKILQSHLITDSSFCGQQKIKEILDSYISSWAFREEQKARNKVLEEIVFNNTNSNFVDIENFIYGLTGANDPLEIAVIKQFIWLVKRKMKGLDVERHLFPILQGKQNSGKSTAVRKLLEPIKLFCSSRSLDMLNDSKELAVLTRKNVIWFDEMSKAKKADVDAVKLHTTSDTVSYRILYTHNEATAKNVSTFIGCTNKSVQDIFYDPTGSRRFYELKCLDKTIHSVINSVNYVRLWKSINENEDTPPIEPYLKELEKAQEKIKALDSVEEFMIEECLMPQPDKEEIEVPFNELYSAYIKWMGEQKRYTAFSKKKMGTRLNELGVKTGKKGGTRLRYINKHNLCGIIQFN